MWRARLGKIRYPREGDDGRLAWRPTHVGYNRVINVPFARRADADRACRLLNEECPADGTSDPKEVVDALFARYGPRLAMRNRLLAECCAW